MDVKITDNSEEVLTVLKNAVLRALTRCGLQAEGYAKEKVPVDTGNLRNSISNKVVDGEQSVYVGTNNEYAPYVELGTGKYTSGGRPDPWVYQDGNGNWHHTHGQRAQPYLKPAVADHKGTYQNIIKDELENA